MNYTMPYTVIGTLVKKTLKAEMSQLRTLLPNCILSRPYKLVCEIQTDFTRAEQSLNAGFSRQYIFPLQRKFFGKIRKPFLDHMA